MSWQVGRPKGKDEKFDGDDGDNGDHGEEGDEDGGDDGGDDVMTQVCARCEEAASTPQNNPDPNSPYYCLTLLTLTTSITMLQLAY